MGPTRIQRWPCAARSASRQITLNCSCNWPQRTGTTGTRTWLTHWTTCEHRPLSMPCATWHGGSLITWKGMTPAGWRARQGLLAHQPDPPAVGSVVRCVEVRSRPDRSPRRAATGTRAAAEFPHQYGIDCRWHAGPRTRPRHRRAVEELSLLHQPPSRHRRRYVPDRRHRPASAPHRLQGLGRVRGPRQSSARRRQSPTAATSALA